VAQIGSPIEFLEISSQTRPPRVVWLLPRDCTTNALRRVVLWCTENVGLWRSAAWPVNLDGQLDTLGEHLVRKYDPDVVYGVGLTVDEEYVGDRFNPFEVVSDPDALNRDYVSAHTTGIEVFEAAETQKRAVARRTFVGDPLEILWSESHLGVLSDQVTAKLAASGTQIDAAAVDLDQAGGFVGVAMLAIDLDLRSPIPPCLIQQRHLALKSNPRDAGLQQRRRQTVVLGGTQRHMANSSPDF